VRSANCWTSGFGQCVSTSFNFRRDTRLNSGSGSCSDKEHACASCRSFLMSASNPPGCLEGVRRRDGVGLASACGKTFIQVQKSQEKRKPEWSFTAWRRFGLPPPMLARPPCHPSEYPVPSSCALRNIQFCCKSGLSMISQPSLAKEKNFPPSQKLRIKCIFMRTRPLWGHARDKCGFVWWAICNVLQLVGEVP